MLLNTLDDEYEIDLFSLMSYAPENFDFKSKTKQEKIL